MKSKSLHISIDDVTIALQSLSHAGDSIYNVRFFRYIYALHRLLGLKMTLYVYAQNREWTLKDVTDIYKHELEEASDWLKFGFHAVSDEQKENNYMPNFEGAFVEANKQIERFAGARSIAEILRLHYWYYPAEYVETLKNHGVQTILTYEGQKIASLGLNQWITNIRIEQDTFRQIINKISHHVNNQPLVIFTHEWALNRRNKIKLAITIALLRLLGYQFICE